MSSSAASSVPALRRDLFSITADGAAFSLMMGLAETYVSAFVLALGHSENTAALITTVPLLLGGILQLGSLAMLKRFRSFRYHAIVSTACQALGLFGLAALAIVGHCPSWLVFVPATIYWLGGMSVGPAWNVWVERLIPRRVRSIYFARRTLVSQTALMFGMVSAGLLLEWSRSADFVMAMFAGLFIASGICRLGSSYLLGSLTDIPLEGAVRKEDSPWKAFRSMGSTNGTRLVGYLLAMQVAVYISGPFFAPYMLRHLDFSYVDYMMLLSCSFVGKIIMMPLAGKIARQYGSGWLLLVGGVGIIPVSALWLVNQNFYYLIFVQFMAGVLWAFYELALLLSFFESIKREERIGMLMIYNLGNAAAMVIGGLIGAGIVNGLGQTPEAYLAVFGFSGVARAATLFLIPRPSFAPSKIAEELQDDIAALSQQVSQIQSEVEKTLEPAKLSGSKQANSQNQKPSEFDVPTKLPPVLNADATTVAVKSNTYSASA